MQPAFCEMEGWERAGIGVEFAQGFGGIGDGIDATALDPFRGPGDDISDLTADGAIGADVGMRFVMGDAVFLGEAGRKVGVDAGAEIVLMVMLFGGGVLGTFAVKWNVVVGWQGDHLVYFRLFILGQLVGFEPATSAWRAEVLPLHQSCVGAIPAAHTGYCHSL